MTRWKLKLILFLSLASTLPMAFSSLEQAQSAIFLSQAPPTPPPTPPPPSGNRRSGGGGLGVSNQSCRATPHPLTALVPESSQGMTISDRPTFWFYVPYTAKEVSSGEFSLLSRDGRRYIYKATFDLPQTPGIVSIILPSSLNNALQVDEYYHWYLGLNCTQSTITRPDLVIDGWINRVSVLPEFSVDAEQGNEFSYDALTDAANQYLATPQNQQIKLSWTNLLSALGLRELAEEPLTGKLQLTSEPIAN